MFGFKNFRIRVGEQFLRTQKIIHYLIVAYFVGGNLIHEEEKTEFAKIFRVRINMSRFSKKKGNSI